MSGCASGEIREFLLGAVRRILGKPDLPEELICGGRLTDCGMDSFHTMTLVVMIEQRFGIAVADDDLLMERFQSVDRIADIISGYLEQP